MVIDIIVYDLLESFMKEVSQRTTTKRSFLSPVATRFRRWSLLFVLWQR